MKKYVLASLLLIAMNLLGSVPGFAVYEQPITFSEISYYTADGTPIDGPQADGFIISATAAFTGRDARTARLLCAFVDKTTGAIQKIAASNAAVWPGEATQTLEVEMKLESIADCDFKCYFIDDLGRHTPLANQAPGLPGPLSVADVTQNGAVLSWAAAEDDFQAIAGYDIYKDGMKIAACTDTSFSLSNLLRNSVNEISVRSNDGDKQSAAVTTQVAVEPVTQLTFDVTKKDPNNHKVKTAGNNLVFLAVPWGAGAITSSQVIAGRTCSTVENGKYPGFTVNTDYISSDDNEIVFEFTYLDVPGAGKTQTNIYVQAVIDETGALKTPMIENPDKPGETISISSKPLIIRNTGVWKTGTITFTNARFTENGAGSGEFNKNFRIYSANSGEFYISSGCLYKKSDYVPMNPNMIVEGGMVVTGMDFKLAGGYGVAYTVTEQEGTACVASSAAGDLSFALTDAALKTAGDIKLEVSFYDGNDGDTFYIGDQPVAMYGGGWRTVAVDTTGAELSAGFAFRTQSGSTVYLKSLQAYAD